jgi:hypothetical protein
MDDHKYTELLILQSAQLTEGTPFCPEDQEMAEYFDGVLPPHERSRLERHLADCRNCLARLGMLERLADCDSSLRIPGDVLVAAKAMAHKAPRRWHKLAPTWAAAAVVVLAVGVLSQLDSTRQSGQESIPSVINVEQSGNLRETRNINPAATGPSFLSPGEGLAIIPADHLFRWTPVAGSRFYQVRIVTDSGDLLWQERITGTEWKLPAATHLTPGAEYFVRVEAFLTDTRALKSDYLPFQVEEQR